MKIFLILPFLIIFKKKATHTVFGAWSPLSVQIWLTSSQGPNALRILLEKLNHGSVTTKCDHGKMPSDMGQLSMVHDVISP